MAHLISACSLLLAIAAAGCAIQPQSPASHPPADVPASAFGHVSMVAIDQSLIFFDQQTGNIWTYPRPDQPAILIGKLQSFNEPLATAEMIADAQRRSDAAMTPVPTPSASSVPLPAGSGSLVAEKLNLLPKNLWPTNGENDVKRDARDEWLAKNAVQGAATFTGKIVRVSQSAAGNVKTIDATIEVEDVSIWGAAATLRIDATFDALTPADVLNWKEGQTITVAGTVEAARPTRGLFDGAYDTVSVTLQHSEVKR